MAEKRMFAKTIIDSDAFIDMPLSTQVLYFHLSMRADDDGFINNPKKIQRMIGANEDDLKVLVTKKFIIPFESGIVVIKHWKIHNYIRGDRKKETYYPEEMSLLKVEENGSYTLCPNEEPILLDSIICEKNEKEEKEEIREETLREKAYKESSLSSIQNNETEKLNADEVAELWEKITMSVKCQSNVSQVEDIGKVRLGKDSIGKDSIDNNYINNGLYIVEQILDYLNQQTKKHFKKTSGKTKTLINARLNEGYKLEDFKKVIDNKTKDWLKTDMNKYLRPETLFGTKFESYLNEKQKELTTKDIAEEVDYEELFGGKK